MCVSSCSGRSIAPTEKLRIAQNQPFYTSAKQQELSTRTLSLAGLSSGDVDNIAADIAAADAAAACGLNHSNKRSESTNARSRRRQAALYPGDVEHFHAIASALAASPMETWMLHAKRREEAEDDAGSAVRTVVWLGRSGESGGLIMMTSTSTNPHREGASAALKLSEARLRMSKGLPPTDQFPAKTAPQLRGRPMSAAGGAALHRAGSGGCMLTSAVGLAEVEGRKAVAGRKVRV